MNKSQQAPDNLSTLLPLKKFVFIKNQQLKPDFPLTDLLPANLPHAVRLNENFVWYVTSFSVNQTHDLWAVYTADKNWNMDVFINGTLVGQASDKLLDHPNWRTPFLTSFPSSLLHPENNQLAIRISAPNAVTRLSPIYVGEFEMLASLYSSKKFVTVTIQQLIALFIWLTFILAMFLSVKRKTDPVYFWFALTTLMWAIHATSKLIPVPYYMNFELWRFMMNASLLWFVIAAFFFTSRTVNKKNRRFEIGLFLTACVIQLGYIGFQLIWPKLYGYYSAYVFMSFILLTGMFSFYRLVSSFYRSRHLFFLTLCTILVFNVGVHDYLLLIGFIGGSALLQYTAPILIILFLAQLISRYLLSIQQKEEIYQSFGIQTPNDPESSQINWSKIKESQRLKTVSEERKRMKQELHDGVSGSLVSVISSLRMGKSRSNEMLSSLEECMRELRSIFDNESDCEQNLAALLGGFRHKIQAKLDMLDIKLRWSIFEIADDIQLELIQANHISRIIQECFTNVIKHSQASEVVLEAKSEYSTPQNRLEVTIKIKDNGIGCSKPNVSGNGLNNMQERAQQLGGKFSQNFSESGGLACLIFYLQKTPS